MKNYWRDKRVIITGAAGFIGSCAVKRLLEKGANVTAVVSPKTNQRRIKNIFQNDLKNISIQKINLIDASACLNATKKQDIILNFAAIDGGSKFKREHSAEIFKTNVRIVLNMLDAAVKNKVDRFLLMSSIEVYPNDAKMPIAEETIWHSEDEANGYVWSKRFNEMAAQMYAKEYGLKIAIARVGNVYGPGDITGIKKERVIPTFIHKILKKEKIELFDEGRQKKQFIYIDDLINALLDLTEKYAICDPVNITGKEVIDIKGISEIFLSIANNPSNIIRIIVTKSKKVISTSKAKKYIKFNPQMNLVEGLRKSYDFYCKHDY